MARRYSAAAGRLEQLAEHGFRIADDAESDRVVLAKVARLDRDLRHRLAGRHGRYVEGSGEARPDADDEVGPVEEMVYRRGAGFSAGAEREGMVLGESALAVECGKNRHAQRLGERRQLGAGPA